MTEILCTSSALHLRAPLARAGWKTYVGEPNRDGARVFPDGEAYVCLPRLGTVGKILVVHAGSPNPNRGLAELELTLSFLRRAGVSSIEVFFTYMPYSMQDGVNRAGETNAAEDLLRKLVSYYGVKRVFAIDPHFEGATWLTGLPFTSVSAHDLLLSAARKKHPDAVFVAPDLGHMRRTGTLAGLSKKRENSFLVTLEDTGGFLKTLRGKVVGVVDDIVETGGTLVKFHEACMRVLPTELFAVATHGVMEDGIARVKKIYRELFLSDSIHRPEANVGVAPLIMTALKDHE